MANKTNFFFNLMTSGRDFSSADESRMDEMVRYVILNSMIFLGATLLFLFSWESFKSQAFAQSAFDFAMGMMTIIGFIVLRTSAPFVISGILTVLPFGALCAFLTMNGGVQGSGVLWIYSYPLLAIFIMGMRLGTLFSSLLLVFVAGAVFVPGLALIDFHPSFAARTVGVYLLVLVCTVVYEKTKLTKDAWVARLNRALKAERDEIAAMKDNLKTGIFLMDKDYIIQPQYARALETILSDTDLSGRNFLDLLRNSLQNKECDTLVDYFTMVLNKSFDAQMLEDINPLHQFSYNSIHDGESKTLACTFAPIDRDNGEVFILVTVADSTREAELELQLSEEENKRQEEMRAMFEVIHVEPRVLHDFIEDTEYEFNRINDVLKNKDRSSHQVMIEVYQGVHAIKSNAVILGLAGFAGKLHVLEEEIRLLRERQDISFQEVLHVTVELDKLMNIKDSYRELIDRIRSFSQGEKRIQEEHVLVQTLERVVEKAASDLGKKAKLVITGIDANAIEHGPRRFIKEVLTQLVRNSVYHGIEAPERRRASGKDEAGNITLSISLADSKIIMQLSDDGNGLDFSAIREKARASGLITDSKQLDDRNALLQVLFSAGFTTAKEAGMHAGRGIGLNLVKDRVKEMKGAIKLQSEDGKGTMFRIIIPFDLCLAQGKVTA